MVTLRTYSLGLAVITIGLAFGWQLQVDGPHASPIRVTPSGVWVRDTLSQWDGQWYQQIATRGYSYEAGQQSSVAFFPFFPGCCFVIASLTRLPIDVAALLLSNLCFLVAIYLLRQYQAETDGPRETPALILALFPTSLFFYASYSESLFLVIAIGVMLGVRRGKSDAQLAALVGVATLTRPVGIAMALPLVLRAWKESTSWRVAARRSLIIASLTLSGLLSYMWFQWIAFDEPLAFVKTQFYWRSRPPIPLLEKASALATLEPFWAPYAKSWSTYWANGEVIKLWFANISFWNPILFGGAVGLAAWGWRERFLDQYELSMTAGILLIPYVTKSYEMNMSSHARFVLPAFPVAIALANLLQRRPPWLTLLYFFASTLLLFANVWAWALGYPVL